MTRATWLIFILAAASVVGMFLALYMLFPPPSVLQILNAVPTAFIGRVLALVITQQTLTVASWSGSLLLVASQSATALCSCRRNLVGTK